MKRETQGNTRELGVPWRGQVIRQKRYKVKKIGHTWHRKCCECRGWIPIDRFRKQGPWLCGRCPRCDKTYQSEWRNDNGAAILVARRKRRKELKEEVQNLRERIKELEAV